MIKSIEKLDNLGIFNINKSRKICEFKKYNLIYGWNGSGKSTLSRFLGHIGGVNPLNYDFSSLKALVKVDGLSLTEKTLPVLNGGFFVFNEDFVKANIDWNGTLNSILLLDEKNIEEVKKYSSLKVELYGNENDGLIKKLSDLDKKIKQDEMDITKILSNIARNVKQNFNLIDHNDAYYSYYDRRKLDSLLNNQDICLSECLLSDEGLNEIIKKINPLKKNKIELEIVLMDNQKVESLIEKSKEIICRKVASKILADLRDNGEISKWVENGLHLHKDNEIAVCAFCGNPISPDRLSKLELHFNEALDQLQSELTAVIEGWKSLNEMAKLPQVDSSSFYDENLNDISLCLDTMDDIVPLYNKEVEKVIELLEKKQSKPFDQVVFDINIDALNDVIKNINETIEKYISIIIANNKTTDEFEITMKSLKNMLEKHYVQSQIIDLSYVEKLNDIQVERIDYRKQEEIINDKEKEYTDLENSISSETLGAEEFNKKLEIFLGYDEIALRFDEKSKGYRIYRNLIEEASNLSEGEKMAIAFIYFIIKLKENGNKVGESIIIIDDPISSFDSNKLFSAYAYMKSECENAKQLFVLTHNYNYFSLILGWFNKKHYKDSKGNKIPNYALYRIENQFINDKRVASLIDGGDSLKQATEYDYVFSTVYSYKDKVLSKKESIFCGNVCRKLIESFLSFKFPKQRADLMALLNAAFPNNEDTIKKESIYKFVNLYSHNKKINVFEELDTDILDSNNQFIVNEILKMIEHLDKQHYDAMVDKVGNQL